MDQYGDYRGQRRGDRGPTVVPQFHVRVEMGEGKGAYVGGRGGHGALASSPPSPLPFRKQLKQLQKVPLRPPRILSSCHLRTTWIRECPGPVSLALCPVPIFRLHRPPPAIRGFYPCPPHSLETPGSSACVPASPTPCTPDDPDQGPRSLVQRRVVLLSTTLLPHPADPANRPRWPSTAGRCLATHCSQSPWKSFR